MDYSRVVGWNKICEHFGSAGGAHALGTKNIFVQHGYAKEGRVLSLRSSCIGLIRIGKGLLCFKTNNGIQLRVGCRLLVAIFLKGRGLA